MDLKRSTHQGSPIDDRELLDLIPCELRSLLERSNGAVMFSGGLHIRGAVALPEWHSLRRAWLSLDSITSAYPGVSKSDVPFAQDCLGDQFLLSEGEVVRLRAEDGKLDPLGVCLQAFLDAAQSDPLEYLQLHPLVRFMQDGGSLSPGQLLLAYPPFITSESAAGNVALGSVPAEEVISFHQDLARQLRELPDGAKLEIRIRPPNKT